MHRHRYVVSNACRQDARFAVGEFVFLDLPADRLAQADFLLGSPSGSLVHPSRFTPEPELPLPDILRDALAGRADHRQFEIVDRSGPVQRQVGDQPSPHQIDQQGAVAGSKDMRPAGEDDRPIVPTASANPFSEGRQRGMRERCSLALGELEHAAVEVVFPLSEWEQTQSPAIEHRKRHDQLSLSFQR